MLRPIDTQTIYQQTPEVSKNQQATKHNEEMQQVQTSHMIQKETQEKQKVVIETQQNPKTDNDVNKRKGNGSANSRNKKKKSMQTKEAKKVVKKDDGHIDLKI